MRLKTSQVFLKELWVQLMDNMQAQAERFGAKIVFADATRLELDGEIKKFTLMRIKSI